MSNSLLLPSSLDNNRKVVLEQRIATTTVQVQPQQPLVQPQVHVQAHVRQPRVQPQVQPPQFQPRVQPQVRPQVQPQVQSQVQPQVQPAQVQPQIRVEVMPQTPEPEEPTEPQKKLSPAEIQRKKINAASEYFRKLRENANSGGATKCPHEPSDNINNSKFTSVPSKQTSNPVPITVTPMVQVGGSAAGPLGPPPPLIPTTSAAVAQKSMPELMTTNSATSATPVTFTTQPLQTFNQQNYAQLTLDGSTNQTRYRT